MPKVHILLPVHNRKQITLKFIALLKQQTYSHFQLILIDDGSTDGTSKAIKIEMPSAVVIRGAGDWWWAGGLQQGINWLKANQVDYEDIILMINDDVIIEPNFIETGIKLLETKQRMLLQAQAVGLPSASKVDFGVKADLRKLTFDLASNPNEVNCLSTMGLFLRYKDILEIGDFYPKFLPHYLSDYEYTIRAYKKKFYLCSSSELKIWYNEETTGYRHFKQLNFFHFLSEYLSNRSATNPFSWSAFAVLTSPKPMVPIILLEIWKGAVLTIVKRFLAIIYWNIAKNFKSN